MSSLKIRASATGGCDVLVVEPYGRTYSLKEKKTYIITVDAQASDEPIEVISSGRELHIWVTGDIKVSQELTD
jgi:hypothetical protein